MSPVTNERAKIIEKIVKLLALADGTSHDAEAVTARNMAAELMAKYDVSVEENLRKEDISEESVDGGKVTLDKHYTNIFSDVCSFNGVYMVYRQGASLSKKMKLNGQYILAGRQADREAALYMMDLVWAQVKHMLAKFRTEFHQKHGFCPLGKYHTSYMLGVRRGFKQKLDDLQASVQTKRQEWGLVPLSGAVVRLSDAETWYTKDNKVKKGRSSTTSVNSMAYNAGKTDGSNIQLRQGVNTAPKSSTKALS